MQKSNKMPINKKIIFFQNIDVFVKKYLKKWFPKYIFVQQFMVLFKSCKKRDFSPFFWNDLFAKMEQDFKWAN